MKNYILLLSISFLLFSCGSDTETKAPSEQKNSAPEDSSSLTIPHSIEHELENMENCTFDKDTVTATFLKNVPEFKNYTWDDHTKEARIVLANNDSLYIHIGGCMHYGVSATLTRVGNDKPFTDHEYWLSEAYWIAERVKGFEPEYLHEVDEKKNYDEEMDDEGLFIDFHENDYSLIVDRKDGYTHITLNHYFH